MSANEEKINRLFINWLSISLVLVFFIIIVGGLTRLTNSGLSITEWELFEGVLPPLSDESWLLYFEQYKKIPQYKLLNKGENILLNLDMINIPLQTDLLIGNNFNLAGFIKNNQKKSKKFNVILEKPNKKVDLK